MIRQWLLKYLGLNQQNIINIEMTRVVQNLNTALIYTAANQKELQQITEKLASRIENLEQKLEPFEVMQ